MLSENKKIYLKLKDTTDLDLLTQYPRINIAKYNLVETMEFTNSFIKEFQQITNTEIQKEKNSAIQNHQQYIVNFLNKNTPYRGLLVYHGLGSGKTAASIFASQGYDKDVVVMTPASLRNNFVDEIRNRFGDKLYQYNNFWTFIPFVKIPYSYYDNLQKLHSSKTTLDELLRMCDELNISDEVKKTKLSSINPKEALISFLLFNNYFEFKEKQNLEKIFPILKQYNESFSELDGDILTLTKKSLKEKRERIIQENQLPGDFSFKKLIKDLTNKKTLTSKELNELLEEIQKAIKEDLKSKNKRLLYEFISKNNINLEDLYSHNLLTFIPTSAKKKPDYRMGMFFINSTESESNYEDHEYKEYITEQVDKFFNLKYKFFSYNSGRALFFSQKEKGIFNVLMNKQDLSIIQEKVNPDKELYKYNTNELRDFIDEIYNEDNDIQNPFNNKVIIIDEIHNLSSMILGTGYRLNFLYELLMRAENTNLIFLSGTPVINIPYQLAITFNLLKGLLKMYSMRLVQVPDNLKEILYKNTLIDRFSIDIPNKTIYFSIIQYNFINNYTNGRRDGVIKDYISLTEKEKLDEILRYFQRTKIEFQYDSLDYTIHSLFPDFLSKSSNRHSFMSDEYLKLKKENQERFDELYINKLDMTIKDTAIVDLQKRIIGLVSHFNEVVNTDGTDEKIFPNVYFNNEVLTEDITEEKLIEMSQNRGLPVADMDEMKKNLVDFGVKYQGELTDDETYISEFQLLQYLQKREIEYEREQEEKKFKNMDIVLQGNSDTFSFFKVLTRQCGNFVFPNVDEKGNEMKRILRSDIKKEKKLDKTQKNFLVEQFNLICKHPDQRDTLLPELYQVLSSNNAFQELYQELFSIIDDESKERKIVDIIKLQEDLDLYCEFIKENEVNDLEDFYAFEEKNYEEELNTIINKLTGRNLSITVDTFDTEYEFNLLQLSPKFYRMLQNINKTKGLVFGYSQFRSVEGLSVFEKVLSANNYYNIFDDTVNYKDKDGTVKTTKRIPEVNDCVRYQDNDGKWQTGKILMKDNENCTLEPIESIYWFNDPSIIQLNWEELTKNQKKYLSVHGYTMDSWNERRILKYDRIVRKLSDIHLCRYAVWSGDTTLEDRKRIFDIYTSSENIYGQKCLILLTTQAGAEGISLKNVRQVHIFEPYWNEIRTKQVIGRARRLNSHKELPVSERNVEVFTYTIKFTPDVTSENLQNKLTDILTITNYNKFFDKNGNYIHILNEDNFMTSDETLRSISAEKTKLLQGFIDLIKETAIDCEFNKPSNIMSDDTYQQLNCLQQVTTLNEYTTHNYDLSITFNDRTFVEKEEYEIVTFRINKISILSKYLNKYIDINDALQNDEEIVAFNFFKYYTLGEHEQGLLETEEEIGKLIVMPDGKVNIHFNEEKAQELLKYKIIQEIIDTYFPDFLTIEKKKKIAIIPSINKKYREIIKQQDKISQFYKSQNISLVQKSSQPSGTEPSVTNPDSSVTEPEPITDTSIPVQDEPTTDTDNVSQDNVSQSKAKINKSRAKLLVEKRKLAKQKKAEEAQRKAEAEAQALEAEALAREAAARAREAAALAREAAEAEEVQKNQDMLEPLIQLNLEFYKLLPPVVSNSTRNNIFWEALDNGSNGNCFYYTIFDGLKALNLYDEFVKNTELSELVEYSSGKNINTKSLRLKLYTYAQQIKQSKMFTKNHTVDKVWAEESQIQIMINYLNFINIPICLLMFDLTYKNWVLFGANNFIRRIKLIDIYQSDYHELFYLPSQLKEGSELPKERLGTRFPDEQIKRNISSEIQGITEFMDIIKECSHIIYANNDTEVHFYKIQKTEEIFNKDIHEQVFNDSGYKVSNYDILRQKELARIADKRL